MLKCISDDCVWIKNLMVFGEENPAKMLERNKVYLKEEAIKRKKEKTNKE